MFKKNDKVIYPRHGAGKIVDTYEFELKGKAVMYLKIEFIDSSITVSVPREGAKALGLRKPLTKRNLLKNLSCLGDTIQISDDTLKQLDNIAHERLITGKVEDTVYLVNILKSLAKKKEIENKNFSYSKSERLETAVEFLRSEVLLVLGKRAVVKYKL